MTDESLNLTRRDFIFVSAAAVSAPVLTNLTGLVSDAEAVEVEKMAEKDDAGHIHPDCSGCQVCTIFFSNCHALNGRHCWCNPV